MKPTAGDVKIQVESSTNTATSILEEFAASWPIADSMPPRYADNNGFNQAWYGTLTLVGQSPNYMPVGFWEHTGLPGGG